MTLAFNGRYQGGLFCGEPVCQLTHPPLTALPLTALKSDSRPPMRG